MNDIKGRRQRAAARALQGQSDQVQEPQQGEVSPEELVEGLQEGTIRIVEFCIGETADGRDYWAFVSFSAEGYAKYAEAVMRSQTVNLPALGEILLTGWGHEPPIEDLEWLKEKYGIDKPDLSKSDVELAEEALKLLEQAAEAMENNANDS